MKIRKYEGPSEKEAMLKVKEELGSDALIVSVKNIKPRGFYKLFKKPYVEVTAALDDRSVLEEEDERRRKQVSKAQEEEKGAHLSMAALLPGDEDQKAYFERFKVLVENMPGHVERSINSPVEAPEEEVMQEAVEGPEEEVVNKEVLEAIYEQLMENEVTEQIVNQLTSGVGQMKSQEEGLTDVISVIYKRIITLLSDVKTIEADFPKRVFFVGPTGVGKTTTIAKVASYYTLNLGKKVAVITSDTYRIAAVEQLRTYANILGIPIKVVYSPEELAQSIEQFSDKDLILVDTAGRSHKNAAHQKELKDLLEVVPNKEVYLVLSVATKYKDLCQITDTYDEIGGYKLLFTKLDETSSYGNIVNMKVKTSAPLSYVTFGQNVPDDISDLNAHEIARQVLGGNA